MKIEEEKKKELPSPSKNDIDNFKEFFLEKCCEGKSYNHIPCTKRVSFA